MTYVDDHRTRTNRPELKMDPGIKEEWIAALRSGEYEQGAGFLHSVEEEYCCLGVLCDIAHRQGLIDRRLGGDGCHYEYGSLQDAGPANPPTEVTKWANLEWDKKISTVGGKTLIDLNDAEGYTFEQIADVIEANF